MALIDISIYIDISFVFVRAMVSHASFNIIKDILRNIRLIDMALMNKPHFLEGNGES
jgi:hypothetical protein